MGTELKVDQTRVSKQLIEAGKTLTDMGVKILTSDDAAASGISADAVMVNLETGDVSFITGVRI